MENGVVALDGCKHFVETMRWAKEKQAHYRNLELAARDELEAILGDSEEGVVDGATVVTWKRGQTTRLNHGLLKKMYPEAYENCLETSPTRRMLLVEPEQES